MTKMSKVDGLGGKNINKEVIDDIVLFCSFKKKWASISITEKVTFVGK